MVKFSTKLSNGDFELKASLQAIWDIDINNQPITLKLKHKIVKTAICKWFVEKN